MVINHIEKLFVTSDSATILNEMEIVHPAARLIVLASHMQEVEVRDCSLRHGSMTCIGGMFCLPLLVLRSEMAATWSLFWLVRCYTTRPS